jgi:fructoselysine-6-P-deglycase FrlB-like protein
MASKVEEIKSLVASIIANKKDVGGVKQVYFVGCGGSLGALYPAKNFMEIEARSLKCGWFNSGEFFNNPPKDFGKNSVIILACHKGNTPETIAAAAFGKKNEATVVLLTWLEESKIIQYGEHVIYYTFGDEKDIAGEKTICGLLLAVELVNQIEGYDYYREFLDGVSKIDHIVKNAKKLVEKRALGFAKEHRDDTIIYTMGSGAGYGAAYMESVCIFMEMQWINSSSLHTGEFFHGPFEITDENIPFVIQISEGKNRPLDERALRFLQTYGKRMEILDAKELGLSVINAEVVDYFNHSLFNNVYPVYNKALADEREHPLTTRRYMWKVSY